METPSASIVTSADTTADAAEMQLEAYRRLGGAARLEIAFRLNALVRAAAAGIRRRHADYDDEQVKAALARLVLGDDLVRRAFPGRDLVDP
jgi:hypothetical protein